MKTATITTGTPIGEVVTIANRLDEIAVEGDEAFEQAILDTVSAVTVKSRGRIRFRLLLALAGVAVFGVVTVIVLGLSVWELVQVFKYRDLFSGGWVGYGTESRTTDQLIVQLAWPVVAVIVAILAYMVIRQAIKGGNTVEMSWKSQRGRKVL